MKENEKDKVTENLQEEKRILLETLIRVNGTNVIVPNVKGEILLGRATYATAESHGLPGKFMLPGGAIDRNELPYLGAQSEVLEESAYYISDDQLTMIGLLKQKFQRVAAEGLVVLYEAQLAETHRNRITVSPEMKDLRFFSKEEIIELHRQKEILNGYMRPIVHYWKYKEGLQSRFPFEVALYSPVDYYYGGTYYKF